MALSVVQSTQSANIGAGTNPKTHAFGSNVSAGSLLVMCTGGTGNSTSVSGVTDSLGNFWSKAGRYFDGTANQYSDIWYTTSASSGACTVSVTFTGGTLSTALALVEVSGWTSVPVVVHKTSTALGSGTSHTFGSVTTTLTEVYAIGHARNGTAFTQTTGPTDSFNERIDALNSYIVDRILTSGATFAPNFGTSASETFAMQMVAFASNPFNRSDNITVADVCTVQLAGRRVKETVTVADVATVVLRTVRPTEFVTVTDVVTLQLRDLRLKVAVVDRVTLSELVPPALRTDKLNVRVHETVTLVESPLNHGDPGELGPAPSPLSTAGDYWTVGI